MDKRFLLCASLAMTTPAFAAGEPNPTLTRIEAKWMGVMTRIRGWNEDSLRQFREGYREYPAEVLEKALAATTFEGMQGVLDAHAGVRAQRAMDKAMKVHSMGATKPEDADDPQLVEARQLVAKALGDDARDLVFIPITPCTVWDSRFAFNPEALGPLASGSTRRFYSHLDGAGGTFAAYGGNPSCPETAQNFIGVRPFAVMMTVYINDATANGWLTIYRDGDPDPSLATISVYYAPGPTRTQTVISKSSRGYGTGTFDIAATSRFASTHASAAVTGYFVKVNEDVGTVSSVATGPGLTGGPITTSGTIDLAATNLLPTVACAATQIARWNGAAWECSADIDTNSGGTVTGVTATGPLASSGGNTPQISFTPVPAGRVLWSTGGAPVFTDSPSLGGILTLPPSSTATAGTIFKGGNRFIHNFGPNNTFAGILAGNFTGSGNNNTALGTGALTAFTGGSNNTAVGATALASQTSAGNNTAVGSGALATQSTAEANTAVGMGALGPNVSGGFGVAIGYGALGSNTAGGSNTAVGALALFSNTTGHSNTAVGQSSLVNNSDGLQNVAVGYQALASTTSGDQNVGIGHNALASNTTGTFNIAVGANAGLNSTTGSSNILIGNVGVAAESGTIRVGNVFQTRAFVAGIRGAATGVADAINVVVDSQGQLGTVSSSAAVKENIADMGAASNALMQLRPVTFDYREHQAASRLQYGLIAEEVERVYPGLVARRPDGTAETVMYQFLPPMMLNEMQKQQRTIEALEAKVARLEKLLEGRAP